MNRDTDGNTSYFDITDHVSTPFPSSLRSVSFIEHPRPSSPRQPSFLPRIQKRMSSILKTPSPPSPQLRPVPPPSPDGSHDAHDLFDEPQSLEHHPETPLETAGSPRPESAGSSQVLKRKKQQTGKRKGIGLRKLKPAVALQNQGSVARDHLASERTFLAYVRTSLAISSTGVALVQLFTISKRIEPDPSSGPAAALASRQLQSYARPLGATTILLGLVVLCIGATRYFSVQKALTNGKFPVARITIGVIAFALAGLIVTVFSSLISARAQ